MTTRTLSVRISRDSNFFFLFYSVLFCLSVEIAARLLTSIRLGIVSVLSCLVFGDAALSPRDLLGWIDDEMRWPMACGRRARLTRLDGSGWERPGKTGALREKKCTQTRKGKRKINGVELPLLGDGTCDLDRSSAGSGALF